MEGTCWLAARAYAEIALQVEGGSETRSIATIDGTDVPHEALATFVRELERSYGKRHQCRIHSTLAR